MIQHQIQCDRGQRRIYRSNLNVSKNEIMQFLNLVSIPQLTEDHSKDCEFILSEKDLDAEQQIPR